MGTQVCQNGDLIFSEMGIQKNVFKIGRSKPIRLNKGEHIWTKLVISASSVRDGMPYHSFPKYRHCLDGGGSDPCLDFCEGFVHMH